ncbi:hypothetical protein [Streptomyces sp. NPDC047999]|uniref:hypothetical protein n=1 Tax=Streptomyces sp. NPDC047999 TaxID=3365497 RepID=UPI003721E221
MAVRLRLPAPARSQPGTGSSGRTTAHSASVMSEGYRRPLWEIATPPVADPVVRDVYQSLTAHLAAVRSGRPAPTQQWFDDFRTLRTLLKDPEPLHVQAFTSPDPALRERYTDQSADDGWGIDGDVIQWQPSESGFLHPWRQGAFGSRS